jgi:predicted phosphoribosyltransferase
MFTQFHDRTQAGQLLAERLIPQYGKHDDTLVLALPRGGVPVAFEVAQRLHAPLDVFVVRKLGVPGHEELAMGAIATGGIRVFNPQVLDQFNLSQRVIDDVVAREQEELERRDRAYRGTRPAPAVEGRTIILIDDGIATGSTMRAAVSALRRLNPARIVIAVPTVASSTCAELKPEADDVIAVITPELFYGVGQWYQDFSQTTDEEVRELLAEANRTRQASATGATD